ncbi:MAG: bifunctional lysylphosphatidylglycerol flippase/synthetase MprF [Labedaea sp.]
MQSLRRTPFTACTVAVLVVIGLLTGAMFTRLTDHPWGDDVSYGLPAFRHGQLWTVITGMGFAATPLCYVALLGSFALFAGFTERRLGTARTMIACAYGQLTGVLGAAVLIMVLDTPWQHSIDVGISAGTMAAAAIASASLARPWRLRVRVGLLAYCVTSLLVLRQLADLEHLVAVLTGLPVGRAFLRRPAEDAGHAPDRARTLLARYGGGSLSWMTTWPGTRYLLAEDGYLAYRRHAGVAITVGDPVGTPSWKARAMAEFAEHCERSGLIPCGFSVGSATVETVRPLGWRHLQVAEDTLVDLTGLAFRGKRWQDVRTARNRAEKEGVEHRMIALADAPPAILAQLREVSAGWLAAKRMPELGFTLGGLAEAMDPGVRVSLALSSDGVVHGFTSWLPIPDAAGRPRGYTLDMMRRRPDAFRPVVDFLIASALLTFQAEGATVVSLSGAPLVRSATCGHPLQRAIDGLGTLLEPCYGFRSLHAYKSKFHPRRAGLHLTYRRAADLPRISVALLRAYLSTSHRGLVPRAAAEPVRAPVPRFPLPLAVR